MSSLEVNGLQQNKTPKTEPQVCAVRQLTGLGISELMTLEAIEFQLLELDAVLVNCHQLNEEYAKLIAALPAELHCCFQTSARSAEQLSAIIQLLKNMPEALWELRASCFNHYEMDFRLAKLQGYLAVLKPLNKKLSPFVRVSELSSSSSLGAIQMCLDNAGVFCWFSTSWRKAKRQALALAANEQLKLADIQMLFPAMIKYVNTLESFDALFAEDKNLSAVNQGINTDLASLLAVREWYKDVEFAITAGFTGEKGVVAGLSKLDKQDAARLLVTYSDTLANSINTIDNQMNKVRLSFPDCQILQRSDVNYLTAVGELKAMVVKQLDILKRDYTNTDVCLSECKQEDIQ